jgi:hypothetical protein
MSIKSLYLGALAACLLALPAISFAGSTATTVTMTATVDEFVEWSTASTTIAAVDWDGHITALNQTRTATTVNLTLYSNADVAITPSSSLNAGVLTHAAGDTLATSYKLTGDIDVPDVAYSDAAVFTAASYPLTHVANDGAYAITLDIQATSSAVNAPDAGDYTANIILTATW